MALLLGFRINQYLDDWINRCLSFQAGRVSIVRLLHVILYLGFVPNFRKCEFTPSQDFEFIGTRYILNESRVTPTDKHKQSIKSACASFQNADVKSARQFMSLIRLLNATFLQVPQVGRLHIRPIQWHLHRYWIDTLSYGTRIPVPHKLRCHLRWWGCTSILDNGTALHTPKAEVLIFTDASTTGWGAHCQGEDIQGSWEVHQRSLHINVLELRTILIALRLFPHLIKGKRVLILCDNSAAVSHLQKCGGVRSWPLYSLSWLIFSKVTKLDIHLQVRHIPGSLNVIADRLSRKGQLMPSEWSLHPQIFSQICKALYTPMVDAFATAANNKLPLYFSPVPDEMAYGVDSLSTPWLNLSLYVFPPTAILTKVVQKIAAEPCQVLLIAPFWPSQIWFWDLVHMSTDTPRTLPCIPKLLRQPGNPPVFDKAVSFRALHVWTIDSSRAVNPNFRPSPWLLSFESRKTMTPQSYALTHRFQGSTADILHFWLKSKPL